MHTVTAIFLLAGTLGPGNLPYVEPFPITEEYRADFAASEDCKPWNGDTVKIGDKAVYVTGKDGTEVFLNEAARRVALDFCWQ